MKLAVLVMPILAFFLIFACENPTAAPDTQKPTPVTPGGLTLVNNTALGLSLSAYAPADTGLSSPLYSAPKTGANQSASITVVPAGQDFHLAVLSDATPPVRYKLVRDGFDASFHLSPLRSYVLDFSMDTSVPPAMVWSWNLDINTAFEVSSLKVVPGVGQLTLTWVDPNMADLASIQVSSGLSTLAIGKGVGKATLTGLTAGMATSFLVTAVYPEIASPGTAGSGTPLAAPVVPSVISVSPVDKAANVAVTPGTVSATFSTSMDASSVTPAAFQVSDGTALVPGSVSMSGNTATFTPDSSLAYGKTFTVTLTTAILSSTQTPLASAKVWSFTTPPPPYFTRTLKLALANGPEAVAVGDVTGDAKADLVVLTGSGIGADADKLFLYPQGAGGLGTPTSFATGIVPNGWAQSLAIGDLDGDTKNEVVVAEKDAIEIFHQDGSGGLTLAQTLTTTDSCDVVVGDFNHDGRADLAGIGWDQGILTVWYQNATGVLETGVSFDSYTKGYNVLTAGNLNGDGYTDLLAMSGQGWVPSLEVLTQTATKQQDGGWFSPATAYLDAASASSLTQGAAVGDLNGDGLDDVAVSYGGNSPNARVGILLQKSGILTTPQVEYPSYDIPGNLLVVDVNSDGRKDLVVQHRAWSKVGVYLQQIDGTLGAEQLTDVGLNQSSSPKVLASGDFDGDGKTDIVAATDSGVTLLFGN